MTFEEAHRAIKRGDIVALGDAVEGGLDPNLADRFGWTLLMLVALKGDTAIGRMLVARGAKIDAANKFGDTPLSLAAHQGHVRFARWLLSLDVNRHRSWTPTQMTAVH